MAFVPRSMPPPTNVPDTYLFWRKQLDLLGDAPPLDVLAATAEALGRHLSAHPAAAFRRPPAPGKWCAAEVLGHLLDIEWVFGFRTRTALFDEAPVVMSIDQDRWVAGQRYAAADPARLHRHFQVVRAANLALWTTLTPADLERTATHQGAGVSLSVGLMLRILAGHDLYHLNQIQQALSTIPAP